MTGSLIPAVPTYAALSVAPPSFCSTPAVQVPDVPVLEIRRHTEHGQRRDLVIGRKTPRGPVRSAARPSGIRRHLLRIARCEYRRSVRCVHGRQLCRRDTPAERDELTGRRGEARIEYERRGARQNVILIQVGQQRGDSAARAQQRILTSRAIPPQRAAPTRSYRAMYGGWGLTINSLPGTAPFNTGPEVRLAGSRIRDSISYRRP